jgi:dihydrofolate reductase
MKLAVIAAVAENGVIGRAGGLPWRLSADLQRFKQLTMGCPIIMGRRTWQSIGRPLPGRTSIVVSRNRQFHPGFAEVRVASDLEAALLQAQKCENRDHLAFVIGGAQLYVTALPLADQLYLTRVLAQVEGDVLFPPIDFGQWRLVSSETRAADERNEFPFELQVYQRCES